MTLNILNDLDELGARIDALGGLGAAIAAALDTEVLKHGDVHNMLATYAGGLLVLQRKIRSAVDAEAQTVDATASPPAVARVPRPRADCVTPCPAMSAKRAAAA